MTCKVPLTRKKFIQASMIFAKVDADEIKSKSTYYVDSKLKGKKLDDIENYSIVKTENNKIYLCFILNNKLIKLGVANEEILNSFLIHLGLREQLFVSETSWETSEKVEIDEETKEFKCVLHEFNNKYYLEIISDEDISKKDFTKAAKSISTSYGANYDEKDDRDWIEILKDK